MTLVPQNCSHKRRSAQRRQGKGKRFFINKQMIFKLESQLFLLQRCKQTAAEKQQSSSSENCTGNSHEHVLQSGCTPAVFLGALP